MHSDALMPRVDSNSIRPNRSTAHSPTCSTPTLRGRVNSSDARIHMDRIAHRLGVPGPAIQMDYVSTRKQAADHDYFFDRWRNGPGSGFLALSRTTEPRKTPTPNRSRGRHDP